VTANLNLYSINGSSTVVWTFVNYARPNWTYIINIKAGNYSSNTYVNSFTYGAGLPPFKVTALGKAIRQIDSTYATCTCLDLDKMSKLLTNLDNNKWNIICKASSAFYITGRIRNVDAQYYEGASKCQYLLWVV
jgi:hypothetical protein